MTQIASLLAVATVFIGFLQSRTLRYLCHIIMPYFVVFLKFCPPNSQLEKVQRLRTHVALILTVDNGRHTETRT